MKSKDEIKMFTYCAIRNPDQEFDIPKLIALRQSFDDMAQEVTDFLNYNDDKKGTP